MARGLPAVWSTLFGAPLVLVGVYVWQFQEYRLVANQPTAPPAAGLVLAAFGAFVVALGCYVHFVVAPEAPTMREGEVVVDDRDPAQRNALAQAGTSVPFLGAGVYLLYFTERPLVYPTVALAVGLYLFSDGIHRYWRNTLTTYFVTTQRVIEEYRFVSLVRNEVPLDKVRAVEERRSAWDSLFGLGDVHVRSGASGDLTVTVDDVYDSTAFADEVRRQLGPDEGEGTDDAVPVDGAVVDGEAPAGATPGDGAVGDPDPALDEGAATGGPTPDADEVDRADPEDAGPGDSGDDDDGRGDGTDDGRGDGTGDGRGDGTGDGRGDGTDDDVAGGESPAGDAAPGAGDG